MIHTKSERREGKLKLSLQEASLLSGIPMSEWLRWTETRMLIGVFAPELRAIHKKHLVEYDTLLSWLISNNDVVAPYKPHSALLMPTKKIKEKIRVNKEREKILNIPRLVN